MSVHNTKENRLVTQNHRIVSNQLTTKWDMAKIGLFLIILAVRYRSFHICVSGLCHGVKRPTRGKHRLSALVDDLK